MKRASRKPWGQSKWIRKYFLDKMQDPFPEPFSIRQAFYHDLPRIDAFVPERVKTSHPSTWGQNFYRKMSYYCSELYLDGRVSYRDMNIFNDAGASEYIYQRFRDAVIPPFEECTPEYPVEVWVENNAAFNSLYPLFSWSHRNDPGWVKVNLISGKGFAKTQQIEALELDRLDCVEHILALVDFDPSGWYMGSQDLQRRLDRKGLGIQVHWIGITPKQIPEERRTTSLIRYKKTDPRTPAFLERFSEDPLVKQGLGYEIQALSPSEIRALVKGALDKVLVKYRA